MTRSPELLYTPEAAAHLHVMSALFGADYVDAIWHLRDREQDRRNIDRAVQRLRVAAILGALATGATPTRRAPSAGRKLHLVMEAAE